MTIGVVESAWRDETANRKEAIRVTLTLHSMAQLQERSTLNIGLLPGMPRVRPARLSHAMIAFGAGRDCNSVWNSVYYKKAANPILHSMRTGCGRLELRGRPTACHTDDQIALDEN